MITKPLLILLATDLLTFRRKKPKTDSLHNGNKLNTWSFMTDSGEYSGPVLFDGAFLNPANTQNNTYKLSMIGVEELSGYTFNLDIQFAKAALSQKGYNIFQSGKELINTFSYSQWPLVYSSGKKSFSGNRHKMHFRIENFDASTDTITISFDGETIMNNGKKVKITNGITTAIVNRLE
jgi:hypothetical protein